MQKLLFESALTDQTGPTWSEAVFRTLGVLRAPAWPDRFGLSLRQWLIWKQYQPVRTLSLFSGGGGLDIAFHDAGFQITRMIEFDPRFVETLKANFSPHSEIICSDIRNFHPAPDFSVDFMIGGPPCQTFSAAGRRAAGVPGISDPRGTLFEEYIRLLRLIQPRGFLFENVYGITGAQNGQAWQAIQRAFQVAGYQIFSRVLDAADYGVPQHRERLFIVGLKEGGYLFPRPTHGPDSPGPEPYYTAGEAVRDVDISDAVVGVRGRYGHLLNDVPPGLNYSFYTREMGHPDPVFSWRSKFSDFLYKADPEAPARTIKAQGGQYTGPFSWENRTFTVAELKRLQTFPDSYRLIGGRLACIEQIGNSVPPQLGRMLALSILDQVFGIPLPFTLNYLSASQLLGFRQRKRLLTNVYSRKAKAAIEKIRPPNQSTAPNFPADSPGVTTRFLGKGFSWTPDPVPDGSEIALSFNLNPTGWLISAHLAQTGDAMEKYLIEIKPAAQQQWKLSVPLVRLQAGDFDLHVFTALWKAFEEKVLSVSGMADLVQLSGYYQYPPRIMTTLCFAAGVSPQPLWEIIRQVIHRVGVGDQLSASKLALLWGCDTDKVEECLLSLRVLGYEVRNHHTNPQIAPGDYLIPYAFPTLTPKSIQLRKSLREKTS